MLISVIHTKGGVGKSTSSLLLGAAAHYRGYKILLLDADKQGSITQWGEDAKAGGAPLEFPVESVAPSGISDNAAYDLVVVDTPPGESKAIGEAIGKADVVIVPTAASPLDLKRVWPTLETTAHRPTIVLLTSVTPNASLVEAARELLDEEGVPVFSTSIPRREGIRKLYGTMPGERELYGYDDVFNELMGAIDV